MRTPTLIGTPSVLAETSDRSLVSQGFKNPRTDGIDHASVSHMKACPVLTLAITPRHDVLVIERFRHQAAFGTTDAARHSLNTLDLKDATTREVPGGNPEDGQSLEDTVRAEVERQTGYKPGEIIRLTEKPLWVDPGTLSFPCQPMLALGCVRVGNPKPSATEFFGLRLVHIMSWLDMIDEGGVNDLRTIAVTKLAEKHLCNRGFI
ncbi:MAG: hypothetical protein HY455_03395 [Parcubacteria group bacterium]|nr:hypothetical protein [Parcubacteria group bacterium]